MLASKDRFLDLRQEADALVSENQSLNSQLEQTKFQQQQQQQHQQQQSSSAPAVDLNSTLPAMQRVEATLREQLAVANEENDILSSQVRLLEEEMRTVADSLRRRETENAALQRDISQYRADLGAHREALERANAAASRQLMQTTQDSFAPLHAHPSATPATSSPSPSSAAATAAAMDALLRDLDHSRAAEASAREQLKPLQDQIARLRQSNESLTRDLRSERDRADDLTAQVDSARRHAEGLEATLASERTKFESVIAERDKLLQASHAAEKAIATAEARERDAKATIRASEDQVAQAHLERDQSRVELQQARAETAHVRAQLKDLLTHMADRIKEQADSAVDALKQELAQARTELEAAHQRRAATSSELERNTRTLQQLQEDSARASQAAKVESERLHAALAEAARRLRASEADRDAALLQQHEAAMTTRRLQDRLEQQTSAARESGDELHRRLTAAESECARLQRERLSALDASSALQRESEQLRLRTAELDQQLSEAQTGRLRELKAHREQLSAALEEERQCREREVGELTQLLDNQRIVAARWRDESRALALRLRESMEEAARIRAHAERENDGLSRRCSELQSVVRSLEQQLGESAHVRGRLVESIRRTQSSNSAEIHLVEHAEHQRRVLRDKEVADAENRLRAYATRT
jgi:chromosome segregation ATPase